jgi:uncharacterized protein (TIGR02145 family)
MKLKTIKTSMLICVILLITGNSGIQAQTMKVASGTPTGSVKLGIQEWAASNLNVSTFRNGEMIMEAKTTEEWIKAGAEGKPAWCYYDNDPQNAIKYGKLYNWYAINDPRGLAPLGWHIPQNSDWMMLVKNLLGVDYAGLKLKSTVGWKSKNGSDKIGFKALPGGVRDEKGAFEMIGRVGQWWSNSVPVEVKKSNQIFSVKLNDNSVEVSYIKVNKEVGLSVRCIKDFR